MTYGRAEELTLLIHQLQEPARPTPRIAACPRVGELADRGQCLCTGGRSVGQFNPFLVQHGAGAEGKMKKIERHRPSSCFVYVPPLPSFCSTPQPRSFRRFKCEQMRQGK